MKSLLLPLAILFLVVLGCTAPPTTKQVSNAAPPTPSPTLTKAELKIQRESMISDLEREYLEDGMDVHFTWPKADTLKMTYVLMSRPAVYKIQNDTHFVETMGKLGVKKVILTDGYNHTWTITP